MVSADGRIYGLFVFMGSGTPTMLDSLPIENLEVMGIDVLSPGSHRTACGKGYAVCGKDEPEVVRLRYPGIDYFKDGGANSVFYWSPRRKAFRRIWLSDWALSTSGLVVA